MPLTWDNISSITERKIMPKVVDNIFDSNAFFSRAKSKSLMKVDGGTTIDIPLNYAAITAGGWFSGNDTLDLSDNQMITAASYSWRQVYTAVSINRLEELKNSGDAAKVSLVKSKMQIAQKNIEDLLGTAMWNTGSDSKALHGVRHLLSTSNTVGGIDQSTNSWWQAQVDSTTTVMTMSSLQTQFSAASVGSDVPTVAYGTRTVYDLYYNLLQPQQRFADKLSASGGFTSLMFNGIPLLVDSHAPASHLAFINENYLELKVHQDEFFRLEPWAKPINQSLRVAKIYFCGNLCSSNNRMHALFTALAS